MRCYGMLAWWINDDSQGRRHTPEKTLSSPNRGRSYDLPFLVQILVLVTCACVFIDSGEAKTKVDFLFP